MITRYMQLGLLIPLLAGCMATVGERDEPSNASNGGPSDKNSADARGGSEDEPEEAGSRSQQQVGSCPAEAWLCDTFEADPLKAEGDGKAEIRSEVWTREGGIDLVAESDGNHAVRVRAGQVGDVLFDGRARLLLNQVVPASEGHLYLRWSMRLLSLALPGWHPYFVNVVPADYDINNYYAYRRLAFTSLRNDFSVTAFGEDLDQAVIWKDDDAYSESGDTTPDTEFQLQADQWFCVEMHFDQGADRVDVQINNQPIEELTATSERMYYDGTLLPDLSESRIWLGLSLADGYEVFYDNVVVSPEPVGCN